MSLKCWHCTGALVDVGGKLVYETYVDPIGNKHMVHKSCLPKCRETQYTAQPPELVDPLMHGAHWHHTNIPLEE